MTQVKYASRDTRAIRAKDAQVVGEAIAAITKKHGKATAELLVKESKARGHPLHQFIWAKFSDEDAAYRFRLWVARDILATITIETHAAQHPAFINIRTVGGHVPSSVVFKDVDMTKEFLDDAFKQMENWYNRFSRFRQASGAAPLEPVFKAVELVMAKSKKKKVA